MFLYIVAEFGVEMEGGTGNNDWGCEGSVSGGMECDEIVVTPSNPCNLPDAELLFERLRGRRNPAICSSNGYNDFQKFQYDTGKPEKA